MNGGKSPMTNNIYFDNRDKSGTKYSRRVRRMEKIAGIFMAVALIVVCVLVIWGLAALVGWA
jgi:Co/Zn/Cd efflux system component